MYTKNEWRRIIVIIIIIITGYTMTAYFQEGIHYSKLDNSCLLLLVHSVHQIVIDNNGFPVICDTLILKERKHNDNNNSIIIYNNIHGLNYYTFIVVIH